MITYERTILNEYQVWATNEHGREPLGKLRRDSHDEWYYVPLDGSYLYLGAMMHIAEKVYTLNVNEDGKNAQLSEEPASDSPPADPDDRAAAKKSQSQFEVLE